VKRLIIKGDEIVGKVKMGDYVLIRTGKSDANASTEEGEYPFFTCAIEPLRINEYVYECECVLVAGNGDLNVKYYNGKFDAYQRTYIIESKNKDILLVPYLYRFLEKYVETLRQQSIGGVIKYIKLANLKNAELLIPSKEKQKECILKMEIIDYLILNTKRQLALLDELVKSRFIEMFGDPTTNQKRWETKKIGECLSGIDSGKSFVCSNEPRTGVDAAVLKLSAVTYGEYYPEENKALFDNAMFVENAEVHSGDLLFTRKNTPELVGMCAYVKNTPSKLMMPDLIFRLNTNEFCNKIFLWKLINHTLFRKSIEAIAVGSAKSMSNISKERLGQLMIIVPPLMLQERFAAFVHQTDKSKLAVKQSLEKLETLKKALMQQYFGQEQ